jgi:hypothetical protein
MQSTIHHPEDFSESEKLLLLRRDQWIRFKERDNDLRKVLTSEDIEDEQIFSMVVTPAVAVDASALEEVTKDLQGSDAPCSLHHRKAGLTLPSQRHHWIPLYWQLKQPSPSTKPTIHCSIPGLSC